MNYPTDLFASVHHTDGIKANESLVDKLLSNVAQERKYSKRHEEELEFELEQEREEPDT